jgi:hypothetical protein
MMTFEIEAADGTIYEVEAPDQATAMKAYEGFAGGGSEKQAAPEVGTLESLTRGAQSGVGLGFTDELYGGVMALPGAAVNAMQGEGFDLGASYKEYRDNARGYQEQGKASNPVAYGAGNVIGSLATGGTAAKAGATLTGRLGSSVKGRMAAGAGEGAVYGGLDGAGNADGRDVINETATGAALGAVTGGLLEGAAAKYGQRRAAKKFIKDVPTTGALKAEADGLYQASRDAAVKVKQPAVNKAIFNMEAAAGKVNEKLQPKTAGVLEYIAEFKGKELALEDMDDLRQVIGGAMKNADPQDKRLLVKMKKGLDATLDGLKPTDIAGDPQGLDFLRQARAVNTRKAKSETLDLIVAKAKRAKSGFEQGLTDKLTTLANNPKKFAEFSKKEQALIDDILDKGLTREVMRRIGMLSPNSTFGAPILSAVGSGGATAALMGAGPLALAPVAGLAAAGMAGRRATTKTTSRMFDMMAAQARTGAKPNLETARKITPGLIAPIAQTPQMLLGRPTAPAAPAVSRR